ncbi:hypothetical protein DT73_02415 [Mangrovibacter sp. MFB070]|uniref:acyl carrier protein n=1 Tax=Mangrovibacter sp. MFB070 TaxID=1224318 RepID=UPI0004D8AA4D|nr:acyl carrier protein [Mangrovibacter sp. MFB070]KEA54245.1 hypothetical protein DT73_02415 [Mangrovibacter sp. MFB070]
MEMTTQLYTAIRATIADAKDMEIEQIQPETTLGALQLDSLDYVELMVLAKRDFKKNINIDTIAASPDMSLATLCQLVADAPNTGGAA